MRESRADTNVALMQALLLHALLFALMFIGLWWTRTTAPLSAAGPPVTAELIDINALSPAMRRTLSDRPEPKAEPLPIPEPEPQPEDAAPEQQPLPTPVPQDAVVETQQKPQDFIPVPDERNQDAVVEQPTPTPAKETKPQEKKRTQEQVDLTEVERQQQAENQRKLAQQELERQKQIDEIRKKRAAAQREAQLAEQRLQQIADVRSARDSASTSNASPPPGNNGVDASLMARYQQALVEAIRSKWTRPETIPVGARCKLQIRQLPGGNVMSAQVVEPCAFDEQGRRSIEAAALKAQPLPYAGFESVFARDLTVNFTAQDR